MNIDKLYNCAILITTLNNNKLNQDIIDILNNIPDNSGDINSKLSELIDNSSSNKIEILNQISELIKKNNDLKEQLDKESLEIKEKMENKSPFLNFNENSIGDNNNMYIFLGISVLFNVVLLLKK